MFYYYYCWQQGWNPESFNVFSDIKQIITIFTDKAPKLKPLTRDKRRCLK